MSFSLINTQTYTSSKSLKGIERKKVLKGKHDDKDDQKNVNTCIQETRNRLSDMDCNTYPQNLLNCADKGTIQLNKLKPALKKISLQENGIPLPFYIYLDNELMSSVWLMQGLSSSMPTTREIYRQESSLS